ncbi:MAG: hypothetical protein KAI25_00965 [Hyphomicrobiaceae bacterium]|nr:hypothetical protein [Hyphomicrobiaceae bacterium]
MVSTTPRAQLATPRRVVTTLYTGAALALLLPATALAQQDIIESAMSAGPATVSMNATIMNWDLETVREGTNDWTCLPDRPDTPGNDPWCVNAPWLNFLQAYVGQKEPTYTTVGVAYMLQGDTPVSNTDPYATEPTSPEDWVVGLGPHLMVIVPDLGMLEGVSTDPYNGGPWIMWPGTPYAHLMIPIESFSMK